MNQFDDKYVLYKLKVTDSYLYLVHKNKLICRWVDKILDMEYVSYNWECTDEYTWCEIVEIYDTIEDVIADYFELFV